MVEGSTAGVISKDSSNIVSLVRKQYKAITTKMAVTVEASAGCKVEKVRALDCPLDDCSKVVVTTYNVTIFVHAKSLRQCGSFNFFNYKLQFCFKFQGPTWHSGRV